MKKLRYWFVLIIVLIAFGAWKAVGWYQENLYFVKVAPIYTDVVESISEGSDIMRNLSFDLEKAEIEVKFGGTSNILTAIRFTKAVTAQSALSFRILEEETAISVEEWEEITPPPKWKHQHEIVDSLIRLLKTTYSVMYSGLDKVSVSAGKISDLMKKGRYTKALKAIKTMRAEMNKVVEKYRDIETKALPLIRKLDGYEKRIKRSKEER